MVDSDNNNMVNKVCLNVLYSYYTYINSILNIVFSSCQVITYSEEAPMQRVCDFWTEMVK